MNSATEPAETPADMPRRPFKAFRKGLRDYNPGWSDAMPEQEILRQASMVYHKFEARHGRRPAPKELRDIARLAAMTAHLVDAGIDVSGLKEADYHHLLGDHQFQQHLYETLKAHQNKLKELKHDYRAAKQQYKHAQQTRRENEKELKKTTRKLKKTVRRHAKENKKLEKHQLRQEEAAKLLADRHREKRLADEEVRRVEAAANRRMRRRARQMKHQGLGNKAIAARLGITEAQAQQHTRGMRPGRN